jgi:hypothetical protein
MDRGSSSAGRAGGQETWSEAFLRARGTLSVGQVALLVPATLNEDRETLSGERAFHQGPETLNEAQAYLQVQATRSGELQGIGQGIPGRGKGEEAEVQRSQRHQGILGEHPEDRILVRADRQASLGDRQGP